jgi:acyl dehydratase
MNWPAEIALKSDPVTPVQLALFAAASGDHNPLHLDPEAASRAGFDKPLVHGMLSMALAGRLFSQHLGVGCIRTLHTRFTGVALVGDTLELTATLEREADGLAHYAIRGVTSLGTEALAGSALIGPPAP